MPAVKKILVLVVLLVFLASCQTEKKVIQEVSLEKELEEILNTLDSKIKQEAELQNKTEERKAETTAEMTIEEKTSEELAEAFEEKDELTLDKIPEKTVNEGEKISFPNLQAVDPDGDAIKYTFSYPLNEKGEWQTKAGDAGEYKIKISASDGKNVAVQEVLVKVLSLNKPPVIRAVQKKITVNEGETVKLDFYVEDPDNKEVQIAYVGWMNAQTYITTYSDAGTHKVKVIVTDGTTTAEEEFEVVVNDVNRAPVFVKGSFE